MPHTLKSSPFFVNTPAGETFVNPLIFLFHRLLSFAAQAVKKENASLPPAAVPLKTNTPLKKRLIGDFFGLYVIEKEFDQEGPGTPTGDDYCEVTFDIDITQVYTRLVPTDLKDCHARCHPRG